MSKEPRRLPTVEIDGVALAKDLRVEMIPHGVYTLKITLPDGIEKRTIQLAQSKSCNSILRLYF